MIGKGHSILSCANYNCRTHQPRCVADLLARRNTLPTNWLHQEAVVLCHTVIDAINSMSHRTPSIGNVARRSYEYNDPFESLGGHGSSSRNSKQCAREHNIFPRNPAGQDCGCALCSMLAVPFSRCLLDIGQLSHTSRPNRAAPHTEGAQLSLFARSSGVIRWGLLWQVRGGAVKARFAGLDRRSWPGGWQLLD